MIRINLPAQPETLRASPSDAADPGSALRLQGEMWGQKMLVVFLFFFSHRNFRPGNQTRPAAKTWRRGHWSSMFPLGFWVWKKQEMLG